MAHFSHTAFIHQVNDKFHFMHTFKICAFRFIACFYQSFIACSDQSGNTAAKHSLFAEKICFSFFAEGSIEHAGTCTANAFGIGKRNVVSFAAGILMHSYETGHACAFSKDAAYEMTWSFRSDHEHVDVSRRYDLPKMDIETMRKSKSSTGFQIRRDIFFISGSLFFVRNQHHDYVGCFSCISRSHNSQTCRFCLGPGFGAFIKTYDNFSAAFF